MDDQHIVLAGVVHDFLEESQIDHFCGGIMGKRQDQDLGPRPGLSGGMDQVIEKILFGSQRNAAHIPSGNDSGVGVNRVSGVGSEDHIPRPYGYQNQVREALFYTDGHDGFGFGIDINREAPAVPVGYGRAQFGDALGGGVAMIMGFFSGLNQLVHNVLRRADIGVAHAQVDDIVACPPRFHLQLIDGCKHVRGESIKSGEFFHLRSPFFRLVGLSSN